MAIVYIFCSVTMVTNQLFYELFAQRQNFLQHIFVVLGSAYELGCFFLENGCKFNLQQERKTESIEKKKDTPYLLLSSFSNYFLFPFIAVVVSLFLISTFFCVPNEFWIRYLFSVFSYSIHA